MKKKTLDESVKDKDFEQVQKRIFSIDIGSLSTENSWFLRDFLNNFKDFSQREKILNNILDKISIFEAEHDLDYDHIVKLKAACLKAIGEDNFDNSPENEVKEIRFLRYIKSIGQLELAAKLYEDLFFENKIVDNKSQATNSYSLINKVINTHSDIEERFKLACYSLTQRQEKFSDGHVNILNALLVLGKLGAESKIYNTKIEGLRYAELAYNLSCKSGIANNFAIVSQALEYMSIIYDDLGDKGKAQELLKQASYVTKHYGAEKSEKLPEIETTLILRKSITDYEVLKVKELIQKEVLNQIQLIAGQGKWVDTYMGIQYGVKAYLEENFLKKILKNLYNEENYKIALALCFEAINIGIMGGKEHNPLVAAIFCQKYPNIIENIIKDHPEYFIDGMILKTALNNSAIYQEDLLGSRIDHDCQYNKFFEEAMIPFIREKIQISLLTPIKNLAQKGEWSEYLDKKYLVSKVLGKNFAEIPDIISIARILAFKEICEGIKEVNSVNFAPIQKFIEQYPELNIRIIDNHPEYLVTQLIQQICYTNKNHIVIDKKEDDEDSIGNLSNETIMDSAENYMQDNTEILGQINKNLADL